MTKTIAPTFFHSMGSDELTRNVTLRLEAVKSCEREKADFAHARVCSSTNECSWMHISEIASMASGTLRFLTG